MCFKRGLERGVDLKGDDGKVVADLREALSLCEARLAAREKARAFAVAQCRTGRLAAESRDYRAAVAAFEAASEAEVQDERLTAELAATLAAAEAALEDLESTRDTARRLAADAEGLGCGWVFQCCG